jgi:hypothetical protein
METPNIPVKLASSYIDIQIDGMIFRHGKNMKLPLLMTAQGELPWSPVNLCYPSPPK